MFGNISAWEIFIILVLVMIIFGGRRLPELGRGLGKAIANFRREVSRPDSSSEAEKDHTPEAGAQEPGETDGQDKAG